jgi:hypothetical protein
MNDDKHFYQSPVKNSIVKSPMGKYSSVGMLNLKGVGHGGESSRIIESPLVSSREGTRVITTPRSNQEPIFRNSTVSDLTLTGGYHGKVPTWLGERDKFRTSVQRPDLNQSGPLHRPSLNMSGRTPNPARPVNKFNF